MNDLVKRKDVLALFDLIAGGEEYIDDRERLVAALPAVTVGDYIRSATVLTPSSPCAKEKSKMTDDLKPCPFCGWDAPYVRTTGIETEVYCQNCTAVGPMVYSVGPDEDVDEVAIKLWNTRTKTKAEQAFDQQIADYVKRGKP